MKLLGIGGAGVEDAEIFAPKLPAVDVEAVKSLGPEEGDDVLPVGRRSAIGVSRLDVPFDFGNGASAALVPDDLSGAFVEREQAEVVFDLLGVVGAFAVEADAEVGIGVGATAVVT